jgi:hypothetical protein
MDDDLLMGRLFILGVEGASTVRINSSFIVRPQLFHKVERGDTNSVFVITFGFGVF